MCSMAGMPTGLDAGHGGLNIYLMRFMLSALATVLSGPVWAASGCEDVWFTRNLIMDRAGYCFDSPLGRALFDNAGCIGKSVTLDPASQAVVTQIRGIEARFACRVDTNQQWLDLPDINFRRALTSHPIRDEFEWACLGWTGPVTPLHAGYNAPLQVIGQIAPGDYVSSSHLYVSGWSYVTTHAPSFRTLHSAGWVYWPESAGRMPCADEAG